MIVWFTPLSLTLRTLIVLLLCGAASTNAALTTFEDRSHFVSANAATGAEDFDGFASEVSFRNTPLDLGPFSLVGSGSGQFDRNFIDLQPLLFGAANVDGTTNVHAFTGINASFAFVFDSPILAFGADFAGYNDNFNRGEILVDGQAISAPVTRGASVRFFGFSSVIPFSVIQFVSVAFQSDGFGLDNVIYASADADTIPQPGGLALVLLALALLRLVRRGGLD